MFIDIWPTMLVIAINGKTDKPSYLTEQNCVVNTGLERQHCGVKKNISESEWEISSVNYSRLISVLGALCGPQGMLVSIWLCKCWLWLTRCGHFELLQSVRQTQGGGDDSRVISWLTYGSPGLMWRQIPSSFKIRGQRRLLSAQKWKRDLTFGVTYRQLEDTWIYLLTKWEHCSGHWLEEFSYHQQSPENINLCLSVIYLL